MGAAGDARRRAQSAPTTCPPRCLPAPLLACCRPRQRTRCLAAGRRPPAPATPCSRPATVSAAAKLEKRGRWLQWPAAGAGCFSSDYVGLPQGGAACNAPNPLLPPSPTPTHTPPTLPHPSPPTSTQTPPSPGASRPAAPPARRAAPPSSPTRCSEAPASWTARWAFGANHH